MRTGAEADEEQTLRIRALASDAEDALLARIAGELDLPEAAARAILERHRGALALGAARSLARLQRALSETPPGIHAFPQRLATRWGIANALTGFEPTPPALHLPARERAQRAEACERLVGSLPPGREGGDLRAPTVTDVALALGSLVPVGPAYAERREVLIRLWRGRGRGGIRGATGAVRAAIAARGRGPFLALHWPRGGPERFSEAAFAPTYTAAARIVAANPDLRGVGGGSWLLDPRLQELEPRYAFFRTIQEANGARFAFLESDRTGASGALAGSATRRKLFEEGRYVPEVWLAVWPRRALLRWAGVRLDEP